MDHESFEKKDDFAEEAMRILCQRIRIAVEQVATRRCDSDLAIHMSMLPLSEAGLPVEALEELESLYSGSQAEVMELVESMAIEAELGDGIFTGLSRRIRLAGRLAVRATLRLFNQAS